MGVISTKSIDQPDEIVSGPGVAKRIVTVGKTVVARIECQPGWRWSKDIKPTAKTASCQHHHQGIAIQISDKAVGILSYWFKGMDCQIR